MLGTYLRKTLKPWYSLCYTVELLACMVYAHFLLRNQYKAVLSESLCPLEKKDQKSQPQNIFVLMEVVPCRFA